MKAYGSRLTGAGYCLSHDRMACSSCRDLRASRARLGQEADEALREAHRIAAEVRDGAEARMRFAASERRLGKEIRALAKLDELNRRWLQAGG